MTELDKDTIRDDLLRGLMTDHGCILHNGPNPENKACRTCTRRVDKVILPIIWSAFEAAEAERARLKGLLADVPEDIEHWASYAGEYFQEKWNLAGDLAKYRAALDSTEGPKQ